MKKAAEVAAKPQADQVDAGAAAKLAAMKAAAAATAAVAKVKAEEAIPKPFCAFCASRDATTFCATCRSSPSPSATPRGAFCASRAFCAAAAFSILGAPRPAAQRREITSR